jgi:hypothetical protein
MTGGPPSGRRPDRSVPLTWWDGPWTGDDPDAAFKAEVATSRLVDPLPTMENLAATTGIPLGALVHHVLARWAQAGSEALLAAGPTAVERMWSTCREAEAVGTDAARLVAYARLAGLVEWLHVPLGEPLGDGTDAGPGPAGQNSVPGT